MVGTYVLQPQYILVVSAGFDYQRGVRQQICRSVWVLSCHYSNVHHPLFNTCDALLGSRLLFLMIQEKFEQCQLWHIEAYLVQQKLRKVHVLIVLYCVRELIQDGGEVES